MLKVLESLTSDLSWFQFSEVLENKSPNSSRRSGAKHQRGKGAGRVSGRRGLAQCRALPLVLVEKGSGDWMVALGVFALSMRSWGSRKSSSSSPAGIPLSPFPFLFSQDGPPGELRASDILRTTKGQFSLLKTTDTWWATKRESCLLSSIFQENFNQEHTRPLGRRLRTK